MPISVDTFHAEVAAQAVQAGASLVNDVSGGAMDPHMYQQVGCRQGQLLCSISSAHNCEESMECTFKTALLRDCRLCIHGPKTPACAVWLVSGVWHRL